MFLRRSIPVNLALQGGGSHGAFTWGVLDALLEDGGLDLDGLSGASAGAMNAVVMAHGLAAGGRDGAREALQRFWGALAASLPADTAVADPQGSVGLAPMMRLMLHWSHLVAPVQMNPMGLNPLRDIVEAQVDFERLRRTPGPALFVATTHANSGRLRLFRRHEISADALLASACLPTLFRAVEIDGEPYWDGGYAANPAIEPLLVECRARDTVLVTLTPPAFDDAPMSARAIQQRAAEIAFTAAFRREMGLLASWRERATRSWLPLGVIERRLLRARFHHIEAHDALALHASDSKLAISATYFETLHQLGRERAQAWLAAGRAHLGRRSTVDLEAAFA